MTSLMDRYITILDHSATVTGKEQTTIRYSDDSSKIFESYVIVNFVKSVDKWKMTNYDFAEIPPQ